MQKSLRRTLAVLLALAMLLGDNAVVFATESAETAAVETAVSTDTEDESAETPEADEDEEDASTGGTADSGADAAEDETAEDATDGETADTSGEENLVLETEEEASVELPLVAADGTETEETSAVTVSVVASDETDWTESYSTFADAVQDINEKVSESTNSVNITVSGVQELSESLQLNVSSCVVSFLGANAGQTEDTVDDSLDFKGYALEITADKVEITDVSLINTSDDKGTLTTSGEELWIYDTIENRRYAPLSKVDISSEHSVTICRNLNLNGNSVWTLNSSISAASVSINTGGSPWYLTDITVSEFLYIDDTSTVNSGAVTADNVSLTGSAGMQVVDASVTIGNLTVESAYTDDSTVGTVRNEGTLTIETLDMQGGTFVNYGGSAKVTTVENIASIENVAYTDENGSYYGVFECGSISQPDTATTKLYGGSTFVIFAEGESVIHNVTLASGVDSKAAYFYRNPDASLSVNSSFTQEDSSVTLAFGILEMDNYELGHIQDIGTTRGVVLFTTDITSFPVEAVTAVSSAIAILQNGTSIYQGGAVYAKAVYGSETITAEAATLNEVFAKLSQKIPDSPEDWTVTVTIHEDSTELTADLTIPAYAHLWFETAGSSALVEIDFKSYTMTVYASSVYIDENMKLTSSAAAGGTWKLNGTYVRIPKYGDEAVATRISNLKITGTGEFYFVTGSGSGGENVIDASIEASYLSVQSTTNWTFKKSISAEYIYLSASGNSQYVFEFCGDVTVNGNLFAHGCTARFGSLTINEKDEESYSGLDLSDSAVVEVETLSITSGGLYNLGTLKVGKLTMTNAATASFEGGSITQIEESAVIYNGLVGVVDKEVDYEDYVEDGSHYEEDGCYYEVLSTAYFYMAAAADVSINGSFNRGGESAVLCYGIMVDSETEGAFEDANGIYVISPESRTKLFSTNNSAFLTEAIEVNTSSSYNTVYQKGTEILVVPGMITIQAGSNPDSAKTIGTYYTWSDVVTYLNTLSNTSQTYIVKLSEDIDADGALTLPSKVGKLIFCGTGDDVTLTFQGDLTLATDLEFENLTLETVDANGNARNAKLTLNGKTLTLDGVKLVNDFASIVGTGNSAMELTGGSSVGVVGTLTTKDLTLDQSELSATGAVTVSGTLTLVYGGALSSGKNKMTLADVVSNGSGNSLEYGGSSATMLSISGDVTSTDSQAELSVYQENDGTKEEVGVVRLSAIRLSTTLVDMSQGTQLVSAAKASAGWFIAGTDWTLVTENTVDENNTENESAEGVAETASEEGNTEGATEASEAGETSGDGSTEETEESVPYYIMGNGAFLTYKQAKVIYCGTPTAENVRLEIMEDDAGYLTLGTFASLQEAFTEITNRNDSTAVYRVVILAEKGDGETSDLTEGTLTWPTKAAMLIISSSDEEKATTQKTLAYSGSLTLGCPVGLMNIVLAPTTAKSTISLKTYDLCIYNGGIDGWGVTGVTGSGVTGTSRLKLTRTSMTINGNLTGVGDLSLLSSSLEVTGTITVGDVETYVRATDDNTAYTGTYMTNVASLTGTATLTKSGSSVTKVTPNITISGSVNGRTAETDNCWSEEYVASSLCVGLKETTGSADYINLAESEFDSIRGTSAIQLVKAANVRTDQITLNSENYNDSETTGTIIKTGGYLAWTTGKVTAALSVTDADGTTTKLADCLSFTDAVTEINNLKTAADYTITVLSEDATSKTAPKALTMPTASYVKSLVIASGVTEGEADWTSEEAIVESVELYYTGNLTMTSDVTLSNIDFVQMVAKSANNYVSADVAKEDYPAIVTVSTGGKALTIDGTVTFNTPINLTGGSKGSLIIPTDATLQTLTNEYDDSDYSEDSWLHGAVSSFAQITLGEDVQFLIREYKTSVNANATAAKLTGVAAMTLEDGSSLQVGEGDPFSEGYPTAATVSITSLNLQGGKLAVLGSLTLGSVTLAGEEPEIMATSTFNITGTVVCTTDNATLYTWQKLTSAGVAQEPYLNVKGSVQLADAQDRIQVAVYVYSKDDEVSSEATLGMEEGSTSTKSAQLLTATSASADCFKPYDNNVNVSEYPASGGYLLVKSGTAILVYYEDEIKAALYVDGDEEEEEEEELVGYYTSFANAVSAINTRKSSTTSYTIELLLDTDIAALTLPNAGTAAQVTITGSGYLYFTNTITLKTPTVFYDVTLCPVKANGAGTTLGFTTGTNDLTLSEVSVGDGYDDMYLGTITGNSKQTTTLDSPGLELRGNVMNSGKVRVLAETTITGSLKTTELELQEADLTVGAYNSTATAAITNLTYAGGTINYYQVKGTSAPALTISGTVSAVPSDEDDGTGSENTDVEKPTLNLLACTYNSEYEDYDDIGTEDFVLTADSKTTLSNAKKHAAIGNNSTELFDFNVNGEDVDDEYIVVKASQGVYLVPGSDLGIFDNYVQLYETVTTTDDDGEKTTTVTDYGLYLDFSQAVTEINNLNRSGSEYTIELHAEVTDACLTDGNKVSALTLPTKNKASLLTIASAMTGGSTSSVAEEGSGDGDAGQGETVSDSSIVAAELSFSGNLSYTGSLTLENLILNPLNTAGGTAVDFNLAVTGAALTLDNVKTVKDETVQGGNSVDATQKGFINTISGTKNTTEITIEDCGELRVKGAVSNVQTLTLIDTSLTTCAAVTVTDVVLKESTATGDGTASAGTETAGEETAAASYRWDALAQVTITNLTADEAYTVASTLNKADVNTALPLFTVNGSVNKDSEESSTAVNWAVNAYGSKADDIKSVETVSGVRLVLAKNESADKFNACLSDSEDSEDTVVAWKDASGYVYNGSLEGMSVKITKGTDSSATYAKTYNDAVKVIDNAGDCTDYTIEFLDSVVMTTAGTADAPSYAALSFPKATAASSVTIVGSTTSEGTTTLRFTGNLTPTNNITFKNIELQTGSYNAKTDFTAASLTLAFAANDKTLTFGENATVTAPTASGEDATNAELIFKTITGTKGTLVLSGQDVYVEGAATLANLELETWTVEDTESSDASTEGEGTNAEAAANEEVSDTNAETEAADSESSETEDSPYISRFVAAGAIKITGDVDSVALLDEGSEENQESLLLQTTGAMTLTNLDGVVSLGTYFTERGYTQLTINGAIGENAEIEISPYAYGKSTVMSADALENLSVGADTLPSATTNTWKIATVSKASAENITLVLNTADATDGNSTAKTEVAYTKGSSDTYSLIKYNAGLYVTDEDAKVAVIEYADKGYEDQTYEDQTYASEFLSWASAVSEINSIGDTTACYRIELLSDLGVSDVSEDYGDEYTHLEITPLSSLTMPTKVKEITIASGMVTDSDGESTVEPAAIFFTPTTVTLGCNTVFENIGLFAVKQYTYSSGKYYDSISYSISAGNYSLTEYGTIGSIDFEVEVVNGYWWYDSNRSAISASTKGGYIFDALALNTSAYYAGNTKYTYLLSTPATKLSGFGTVEIESSVESDYLTISGGLTGVGTLELASGVELYLENTALSVKNLVMASDSYLEAKSVSVTAEGTLAADSSVYCSGGDFTAKALELTGAQVGAKNVTVSGTLALNGGTIKAGTTTVGDGQIRLADIVLYGEDNSLIAKQDKNGNSLLSVTGTVTLAEDVVDGGEGWISVGLYYNNSKSDFASLYEGMTLLTAAKAESSWFSPCYDYDGSDDATVYRMGSEDGNYTLYKSGSSVKYGSCDDMEVLLRSGEYDEDSGEYSASSYYLSFEDAVSAINSLASTAAYYEIDLLQDVDITNAKGVYTTLTLPTKAAKVTVNGGNSDENEETAAYTLAFSGALTLRCDMELDNVTLQAWKNSAETSVSVAVGNYALTADGLSGNIGAITGSSSKGALYVQSDLAVNGNITGLRTLKIEGGMTLTTTGNTSVYEISFPSVGDEAVLHTEGTLTTTLIENGGCGAICKYADAAMTLKGATVNKELTSLVNTSGALTIYLLDGGAAGTSVLTDANLSQTLSGYTVKDYDEDAGTDVAWITFTNGTKLTLRTLEAS